MNTITVKQLQDAWDSWMKVGVYKDQRFGQWVFNEYQYEVGNSYNIERPYQAYQVIFESIGESITESGADIDLQIK